MKPFVPKPLPPGKVRLEHMVAEIGRANASLARYDGLLESLVNPEVLLSPLLMREAELSSRIEGTVATANEAYQQEAGATFEEEKSLDIGEILNYRSTMRLAATWISDRPINLHLIRQMHEQLMSGVRGADKKPGSFRNTQNWIGSPGCSMEEATYVPPPPQKLDELLEQFEAFLQLNDQNLDPIVQTAMVHAQFEMIHPFDDGNGRIGRLIIPLLLARKGCLVSPSFYISAYLETHRDEYYHRLEQVSQASDWEGWIAFFLRALIKQAETNLTTVRGINSLYSDVKQEVSDLLHSEQGIRIVDLLFDTPVFNSTNLFQSLGIQRQRAAGYIKKMKEAGIVSELRAARGRTPAILSFDRLWQITR